eukprot:6176913-Pleurochrysis_carterae.AAC.2
MQPLAATAVHARGVRARHALRLVGFLGSLLHSRPRDASQALHLIKYWKGQHMLCISPKVRIAAFECAGRAWSA